jgi:hypothetical protein
VNGRKSKNTIWSIQRGDGTVATNFEELTDEGISHFHDIFKEDQRSTVDSILRVVSLFFIFVDQEQNDCLMV